MDCRWHDGRLDYCRHRVDQQLLQAAGSERYRNTGAAARDSGAQTVRLSYLPLAPLGSALRPLSASRAAMPGRGAASSSTTHSSRLLGFSLPGQWTSIDPSLWTSIRTPASLTLPWNVLGLAVQRGLSYLYGGPGHDWRRREVGMRADCAQCAVDARAECEQDKIDTMQMQYFSSSLVDETVQAWLRPYVANRLG